MSRSGKGAGKFENIVMEDMDALAGQVCGREGFYGSQDQPPLFRVGIVNAIIKVEN
jgi:hypothetical protein